MRKKRDDRDIVSGLYKQLGENIRRKRESLEMSQGDLGTALNLTRASISVIESGKQRISISNLYDICVALGAELDEILPPIAEYRVRHIQGMIRELSESDRKAIIESLKEA